MEWLIIWLVMGGIVGIIANSKGRSGFAWFVYGVLIWPIALVHILVSDRREDLGHRATTVAPTRKCPWCAEIIKAEAVVCRYCGRDVGASPTIEGRLWPRGPVLPPDPGPPPRIDRP